MQDWILYQNDSKTVFVIDIPRSIEQAQAIAEIRLMSSDPLQQPFSSTEPKTERARERLGEGSVQDLILQRCIQFGLDEVREAIKGAWCLSRVTQTSDEAPHGKILSPEAENGNERETSQAITQDRQLCGSEAGSTVRYTSTGCLAPCILPPRSSSLNGSIQDTIHTFRSLAPTFDIILLDPPWPNRSALRSRSYETPRAIPQVRALLSAIPIHDHLAPEGIVAIWVTNKATFCDLILEPGGLFDEWGVELLEEWIWVKVTKHGEPMVGLDSRWRKPWEKLLVARKFSMEDSSAGTGRFTATRRLLFGVPDLHSRKPSLKSLLEEIFQKQGSQDYKALEVFARNLTAGWWSWGDEVLKFQRSEHWVLPS